MKLASIAKSALVFAALPAFLTSCSDEPQSVVEHNSSPTYPTNSAGDSYGSAANASSRDEEPDLVRVLSDDGKIGYVYKSDLYADEPANPSEAIEMQKAADRRSVEAIYSTLPHSLGVSVNIEDVDTERAREVVRSLAMQGAEVDTSQCASAISKLLALAGMAAGANGTLVDIDDNTVCTAVVKAATSANTRSIRVYKSDGTTEIGYFTIGG